MNLDDYRSLRAPEVAELLSVGINTVWRWTRERPDFPKPVKLGNTTSWLLSELVAWRAAQRKAVQQ